MTGENRRKMKKLQIMQGTHTGRPLRFSGLSGLGPYLQDSVQNGRIPVGAATCRPRATCRPWATGTVAPTGFRFIRVWALQCDLFTNCLHKATV